MLFVNIRKLNEKGKLPMEYALERVDVTAARCRRAQEKLPPISRRESQRIEKAFRPAAAARISRAAVSMGSKLLTRPAGGLAS